MTSSSCGYILLQICRACSFVLNTFRSKVQRLNCWQKLYVELIAHKLEFNANKATQPQKSSCISKFILPEAQTISFKKFRSEKIPVTKLYNEGW